MDRTEVQAWQLQAKKVLADWLEGVNRPILTDAYGYGDTPTQARAVDASMWADVDDDDVTLLDYLATWVEPLRDHGHNDEADTAYERMNVMIGAMAREVRKDQVDSEF